MIKQSMVIQTEITGLEGRRAQLTIELGTARQANEKAQARLIASGSAEAIANAGICFATFSALQEAIASIDNTLVEKREQQRAAREDEEQQGKRERIAAIDCEMSALASQYCEGRG